MTHFEQTRPGRPPGRDRFGTVLLINGVPNRLVLLKFPFINVTIWAVSWKSRIPEVAQWDPIPGPTGSPPGEAAGGKK